MEEHIMRVVVNTPAELVASHRPRLLPALLGTLVVAVAARAVMQYESMATAEIVGTVLGVATAAVIVGLVSRSSEFRFDAVSGELRWKRWGFLSRSHGTIALESIERVIIGTNHDGEGEADRVVLITKQGRLPLTWHYSSIEPHEQTAQAIRLWLREHGISEPSN
jgi:hypothetical protein